jgi:hypothetical protein
VPLGKRPHGVRDEAQAGVLALVARSVQAALFGHCGKLSWRWCPPPWLLKRSQKKGLLNGKVSRGAVLP